MVFEEDIMPESKVPDRNSVHFSWLNNYSGLLLKTPTKTLLIDPVDVKAKTFPSVDAVLVTHEHYDHFDQRLIAEIQKNTNCTIIADAASTKSLKLLIPPNKLIETHVGDKIKIGEVTVKTEKCNHTAKNPVTYIITSEDNVRLWHTADSLPFPEMAQMSQKEPLDVVFCTVGIAQGCTPKSGSEIAWLTKPKVAVPYHANSVENQKQFRDILRRELPKTTCLIPEVNKVYQVSLGERKA
jgi:L-ascorbate metabolism protein UlaG (beta-lactamase superfamily)